MDDARERKWTANSPEQFHWAVWDEEEDAVLFHEGSGDTLMLNPLGEFLLKELKKEIKLQGDLSLAAAVYFDLDNDDELKQVVESSLKTFHLLGLVRTSSL